jgi:2-polyprenyl-3-methyl-5-hydroxy-6-metoxy-1,4-benzoquinol methylase
MKSNYKPELIIGDIYSTKIHKTFDLIILKDTLEHIHNQGGFMYYLKRYMNYNTKIFIAFSPWSMPFGGHQQMCNSFLRYIPYLHLLPFYEYLLRLFENPKKVNALLEIKETKISIMQFKEIIKGYKIHKESFYLISPSYIKFGLRPVSFLNILFLITSYWCVISKNN